jgi:hypothetical protein
MSTRTEDRLRAALSARADLVTPDQLRPAAPPVPRQRQRVLLPALAGVAAVAAMVAGVGLAPGLLSRHDHASRTQDTSVTAGPSAAPTTPARQATGKLSSADFAGMAVPVPEGWRLDQEPGTPRRACLHPAGGATGQDCALLITAYGGYDPAWRFDGPPFQVDSPPVTATGCDTQGLATVTSSTQQVGGRQAEFRRFTQQCGGSPRTTEQWTVTSYPVVRFWRSHVDTGPEPVIHQILDHLSWTAQMTSTRAVDRGYLVSSTGGGGHVHLRLDRTILVLGGPDNGMESNSNTQTYDYPVAPDVRIIDQARLCYNDAESLGGGHCTLDALLRRLDEGDHRADGGSPVRTIPVVLVRDSAGVVVRIVSQYHP